MSSERPHSGPLPGEEGEEKGDPWGRKERMIIGDSYQGRHRDSPVVPRRARRRRPHQPPCGKSRVPGLRQPLGAARRVQYAARPLRPAGGGGYGDVAGEARRPLSFILPLLSPSARRQNRGQPRSTLGKGRFILGVGLGGHEARYPIFGIDPARRVRRFTDSLELIKRLWTEDEVSFDNGEWRVDGLTLGPKPVQQPHPPIWFGARAEAAIKRAVRLGDGFMGAGASRMDSFLERARFAAEAHLDEAGPRSRVVHGGEAALYRHRRRQGARRSASFAASSTTTIRAPNLGSRSRRGARRTR